jgi:hypothetical protein
VGWLRIALLGLEPKKCRDDQSHDHDGHHDDRAREEDIS